MVRGGSAYQDELFDDLMPEPPRRLAAQRLHTYTYNLRQTFTMIGGDRPYVLLRRHRYTLAEDAFDVDLWSLRDAITRSATRDDPARTVALRQVVELFRGPLAQDTSYLWVDAYREAVRRDYLLPPSPSQMNSKAVRRGPRRCWRRQGDTIPTTRFSPPPWQTSAYRCDAAPARWRA